MSSRPSRTTPTSDGPRPTVVIVGASLAGATVARTLREDGFGGRIILVGEEPHEPYERPALSKGYLLGTADRESVFVQPSAWYADHDVELLLGSRVTAIDRAAHEVRLDSGRRVAYTSLVLATGSSPRRLDVPGAYLRGVHYLRTLSDADRLVQAFTRRPRVGVIGGGWIGLEVAAAARETGLEVTVLEVGALPLLRVLGPEVAQVFADLHRDHGVDLRTGVGVAALCNDDGDAVTGIELTDGETVPVDLVLVGVGVLPGTALAEEAGLAVDGGIVVDEHLRTADPDVYAAGDVARSWRPVLGRPVRVDHWANAGRQGVVAARAIQGKGDVDDRLPYFYTDQYDVGMEYVGYVDPEQVQGGTVVCRGDVAGRQFLAFWLEDDRVLAGMNVNVWDVSEEIEALIRRGQPVDPARLADPTVRLSDV